ncbi:pentapeptide repeat-containing protein [Methylobacterium sp. E-025]|uniref:thermonuclease family protein n=1 Tax=Methylobacterium sp. E-025 TaxID=2836561 RepID=UPI001FBA0638|nr:pentapeptide repeat-containing protein [Methylobacterium sp. E-025]MCJ2110313.1 pentapeptide repeat-containing protein [Methylobacterium sp. E-025]
MGWTGRMLAVAACALAASAARVAAAPRSGTAECLSGDGRTETLSAVEPRGELALASGARAVLGSVRWPDDPEIAKAATERLLALRGRPLTVVARGEADRWGRLRIDALSEADGPVDLAGDLVGAGLAQVDAGEGDALCRPGLLAVEEAARTAGLGLWHQPSLEASDGPGPRAAAGRFVVVQGTISHVGERPSRTYLDFAARGEDGLTVTVSKRTWRRMREHGLSADRLKNARVRVRGVVEIRRGPTLDIAVPETIEVLEAPTAIAGASTDGERALRR